MNPFLSAALAAIAALACLLSPVAFAQGKPPVIVTDPSARVYRVAIQRFAGTTEDASARLREKIGTALEFSSLFRPLDPIAFLGADQTPSLDEDLAFACGDWSQIGADALVQGEIRSETKLGIGKSDLVVEFRVRDVARSCRKLIRKRYRGGPDKESEIAKRIADDIVGAFTGSRGVSATEITFVSSRPGNREIFVMDADGGNVRQATHNKSINTFPSWAPDGRSIVYTSYREKRRPGLFLLARGGGSPGRILGGLMGGAPQYRAVFDPEGKRLAVVMSANGAAEIFTVRKDGKRLDRLTENRNIDISPSWSPDGKRIAYVSDRSGAPQIYLMDSDGSNTRRLTFQGAYNTHPAWSPDGRWIAYESRLQGQFDIWLIDPDGAVNFPLVSHPRSDEHPSWSPDSRLLAFSSTRRGRADIFVTDLAGDNIRRLTRSAGDNTNPSWGPYGK